MGQRRNVHNHLRAELSRLRARVAELEQVASAEQRWRTAVLGALAQVTQLGFLVVDTRSNRVFFFNRRFCEIWGFDDLPTGPSQCELPGSELLLRAMQLVSDQAAFLESWWRLWCGEPVSSEDHIALCDGRTIRRLTIQIRDSDAEALGRFYIFEDITSRQRAEAGLRFLAEASTVLASSLDYEVTLQSVVRLAVPYLADWSTVRIVDDQGVVRSIASLHRDPRKLELIQELEQRYPFNPDDREGVAKVFRTGRPELLQAIPDAVLVNTARDANHLALLRALTPRSLMIVPLKARGRTLGTLAFALTESERQYSAEDLAVAEELARYAALAVENASLYSEVQEALSARDEFLAIAAHELKTPVTSLAGFAELLMRQLNRSGQLDPDLLTQAVEAIDEDAAKLARLISQLLDISRLQGGRLVLDRVQLDVAALVRRVAAGVQVKTSGHTLNVRAPQQLLVFGDALRLEQVLINLVDNALKYSPAGGPIEIELSSAGCERVRLVIADQGLGIPVEHRAYIFERFYQAHSTGHFGGLGLGLYISRQIMELHGGQIEAEFPATGGTRMVLHLPVGLSSGCDTTKGAVDD